jgi:alpha-mannosidase
MDREWYASGEEFRFQAASVMDRVLAMMAKSPEFKYLVDGQSSIIEDYLELHPHRRSEIEEHIATRRLLGGPWYVQPDEFMVCGESHIRNLQLGQKVVADLGGTALQIGYLPDSFGHVAQMPQILRGFGIENAFVMRGVVPGFDREFDWTSPDGSAVLTIHFPYGNFTQYDFSRMEDGFSLLRGPDAFVGKVAEMVRDPDFPTQSGQLLLTYNCDHLPPRQEVLEDIKLANELLPDHEIVVSDLEDLFADVRRMALDIPVIAGELRAGDDIQYLKDTAASRPYLKTANKLAETLLIHFAEPLGGFSWLAGAPDPTPFLARAWKLVLLNQTHDGICGCGVDKVHEEMMIRFQRAMDICRMVARRNLESLFQRIDSRGPSDAGDAISRVIWVFFPQQSPRDAVLDIDLTNHTFGKELQDLRVTDARGQALAFQVLSNELEESIEWEFETVQRFRRGMHARIAVQVLRPPSVGYTTLHFSVSGAERSEVVGTIEPIASPDGSVLDTADIRVTINPDGTFDLIEKSSGAEYRGLNEFIDGGDCGDVYNYRPPLVDRLYSTKASRWRIDVVDNGPLLARVKLSAEFWLPSSAEPGGAARAQNLEASQIETILTVRQGSKTVELSTTVTNSSRDHRLRVHFPTDIQTENVYDDGHFYVNQRSVQQFPFLHPARDFVALEDGHRGLAIFNRGVSQYEVSDDGRNSIALSLFRSQDVLYRQFFSTRLADFAGAQLLGTSTFEYAVHPYTGSVVEDNAVSLESASYGVRFYQQEIAAQEGPLPADLTFVELGSTECRIDSLRKHPDRDSLVIRIHNSCGKPVVARVDICGAVQEAFELDLREERVKSLDVTPDNQHRPTDPVRSLVTLGLGPHAIATAEFVFDRGALLAERRGVKAVAPIRR